MPCTQWTSNLTAIGSRQAVEVCRTLRGFSPQCTHFLPLTHNVHITVDCSVKLWNFDALLSSPANAKEALLSTLSSHTKSVNVVRWSKDGKYLASGSDDNYILIHKYTPGAISNQTFGSSSAAVKNKETWTRYDMMPSLTYIMVTVAQC